MIPAWVAAVSALVGVLVTSIVNIVAQARTATAAATQAAEQRKHELDLARSSHDHEISVKVVELEASRLQLQWDKTDDL